MSILNRNSVRTFGRGTQPMLFAHGFGCDQSMWQHITPAFEEHYRIVTFDYVGCGRSDKSCYDPIRYSTLEGYAEDILEVCSVLGLRDVIFVGHSVSGMIGMLAASRRPGVFSRIIMLGPSACYINDVDYKGGLDRGTIDSIVASIEAGGDEWAEQLAPVVMGNPDRPDLAAELSSLFCELSPEVAQQFAKATFYTDSRAQLSSLQVPTLIMQCTNDVVAPDAAGQFIYEAVPGSKLVKLSATGHVPQVSAPEETVRVMQAYLNEAG